MNWNDHSNLPDSSHAFLSPSNYAWINYDDEKLAQRYMNHLATLRGTELHAMAAKLIGYKMKMPRNGATFNAFVNDAIGFRMNPEQKLWYSPYCFGTSDAISFNEKKGLLRVHDLKTGVTPASLHQLEVYAALFCLEYGKRMNFKPGDIHTELRIYQNDEIQLAEPDAEILVPIMDRIQTGCKILERIDTEGK